MKPILFTLSALLLLAALALAPDMPTLNAAQPAQQATSTPMPEAEHEHSAMATPEPAPEEEPTMADLLARIEALEATVAELYAEHEAAHMTSYDQANSVNVAIYLLDSAGLHELETRLVSESEILPGDSGAVSQIARLLSTVDWPDDLAEEAASLGEKLDGLADALADDDLETVKPLSTDTHVAYHVFSHNAQMWLEEMAVGEMSASSGQVNRVNTAVYLLDGAGLHGLAERLSEDEEILPGDSGEVSQIARVLSTVDWPDELAADAAELHETLAALAEALADDDLEAATDLADAAHDLQHDFSHAAQHWMEHHGHGDEAHEGEEHEEHEGDGETPHDHSHGG